MIFCVYMISYMIFLIYYDIINDILYISWFHRWFHLCPVLTIMLLLWQALIFPQQYALIMTPTLAESWIPTRSVTLLSTPPLRLGLGWRHSHSCYSFETHSQVHQRSWHWTAAAKHSSAAARGDYWQDYAGGNTGRRHAAILLLAMCALNSSSSVHCARQAPRGAVVHTKRFPWFISARLSLSNWPLQCHAASWRAHAIWLCQQPAAALPLHLPSDQCPGASTPDSMLRWRQQPSYYSAFLQGLSASWERLSWHTARLGQLQQTPRGEHLDVALRQGSPPGGAHRGAWKNQEWVCQQEQDQGSWDEEAVHRTGRVWGCRRQCRMNRQSMISFMISMFMISM